MLEKIYTEITESVLVLRRSRDERLKNYKIATLKKVQGYIKTGSEGDLNLSKCMNNDDFIVRNLIEACRLITAAQNKIFQIEGRERLECKHAGAKTGLQFNVAMSIAAAALLLKEPVDELESDVMRQAFRNSDIISV